jgi:DNA-directed RNA polymerase subunit RPC12/RpoP
MTDDDSVRCPKCSSIQIHAEKRGWRLTTGFFGSGKIVLTCLKCGSSFRPGDYATYSQTEKHDTQVRCLVLAAIAITCYLLTKACSVR